MWRPAKFSFICLNSLNFYNCNCKFIILNISDVIEYCLWIDPILHYFMNRIINAFDEFTLIIHLHKTSQFSRSKNIFMSPIILMARKRKILKWKTNLEIEREKKKTFTYDFFCCCFIKTKKEVCIASKIN
jgi:hypothetical protein